jgi:hypothetical protein
MLQIYALSIVAVVITLFCFGYIGPRKLREALRKFNKWYFYDSSLFLPIDPYQPILKSLENGIHNFWPSKKRLFESLRLACFILVVAIISVIGSVIVLAFIG